MTSDDLLEKADALAGEGRHAEAVAAYDAALAADPANGAAHANRGTALQALGRLDEALAAQERAVALLPRSPPAQFCRANALRALGRGGEAVAAYDAALALDPNYAAAWTNRGNTLLDMGRAGEAAQSHDRAVALSPGNAGAHLNRANALRDSGALEAALDGYARAIALQPDLAEAYWNRGLTHLLRGEFGPGWRDYEWRKQINNPVGAREFSFPLWRGEDLTGKTILVHAEQGLGDTIQFCRYLPWLSSRGARVLFAPQKSLAHLMRSLGAEIVDADTARADYHVPLLSLPLFAGHIPNAIPYLAADPARVAAWKARLGSGFNIGICWQGATGVQDIGRSLPLKAFAPLAALPGVNLISLHRGTGESQLADLPQVIAFPDLDGGGDAFADTAALIASLDLVVTSDTAIAHLAGALGAPTWVALKQVPDWRWLMNRDDSPWYPGMRLFRQTAPGDWTGVLARVAESVRELR